MSANRFGALDGWRGLAALAIVFYHLPIAHPLRALAGWKNLELFVDLFFVLSGFVMMHAWGGRLGSLDEAAQFMKRRFWRVWPLHMVVLGAFVGIELVKLAASQIMTLPLDDAPFAGARSVGAAISNMVLTQSLNLHGSTTWNGPGWSISVEFWAYAVFAVVMMAAKGRLWPLVLVAVAALAGLAALSPIGMFATHDFGLLRGLYGFFTGAAAYRMIAAGGEEGGLRADTALELAVILAMSAWMISTGTGLTSLFAPIVFGGVIVTFARGQGIFSRVLRSAPLEALGAWSYSVYLVHTLIFYVLRLVLMAAEKLGGFKVISFGSGSERVFSTGSGMLDVIVMVALMALTIVISRFTYRWIERPFMGGVTPQARIIWTNVVTCANFIWVKAPTRSL